MLKVKDLFQGSYILLDPGSIESVQLVTKSNSSFPQLMMFDYLSVTMNTGAKFCVQELKMSIHFEDQEIHERIHPEALKC